MSPGEQGARTVDDPQARGSARASDQADGAQVELRRVARGGALNMVGAALSSLASMALVVLVARSLTQDDAGIFFAATSVFLLVVRIAALGTRTGLVYFVARFRALGATDRIHACLRIALRPVVALALLTAGAMFALAPQIADAAVDGPPGSFALYLRILAVFLPFAVVTDAVLAATRGFGVMRPTAALDKIGRPAAQVLLALIAVSIGSGAGLTAAWAIPYVASAALGVMWLRSLLRRRGIARAAADHPGLRREFWRFTAPRAVASVAQLALQRLDIVLVAALRGPAQAAIYAAATRFLVVGQLGALAISTTVQPRLSERLANHDRTSANLLYGTATGWLVLATWPLYLMLAIFAPVVLQILGRDYRSGATVVVVLALAMLVATGCGMVDMVLSMAGRTTWNLGNAVLALAVNIGLNLVLIPRYGIMGAAAAWAAAILLNNLVPLAQVGIGMGLHPFGQATWRAMAICATCFGVVPLVVHALAGASLPALAISAGIGTALFAVAVWRNVDRLQLRTLMELRVRARSSVPGRRPLSRDGDA